MKTDEIIDTFRTQAVRDLTSDLEVTRPYQFNTKLAASFYNYMLDLMNVEADENERVEIVEDVLTTYDHDLSDYLMLKDYQIDHRVIENEQDPIIEVKVTCKSHEIFAFRMSFTTARLMARKRQLERA